MVVYVVFGLMVYSCSECGDLFVENVVMCMVIGCCLMSVCVVIIL